jgi:hypothetical protein
MRKTIVIVSLFLGCENNAGAFENKNNSGGPCPPFIAVLNASPTLSCILFKLKHIVVNKGLMSASRLYFVNLDLKYISSLTIRR